MSSNLEAARPRLARLVKALIVLSVLATLMALLTDDRPLRKSFVDTFDTTSPLSNDSVVPLVGSTAGGALDYFGFAYGNISSSSSSPSLQPPSGTSYISFSPLTQSAQGQPSFLPSNASITTLHLESLHFACINITDPASLVPVSCTVQMVGVGEAPKTQGWEWRWWSRDSVRRWCITRFVRLSFFLSFLASVSLPSLEPE